MSDVKDKLRSLLAQKGLMTGSEWLRKHEDLAQRRAAGEFEIDKVVPGEIVGEEGARFYLVRQDFPLDARQGDIPLAAVLEAIPEHIAFSACDSDLEEFDPATALFLDTETTGLAGGTGTVPFLIGAGYFADDVFRLEQCFMRDYDEEEPMLRYLEDRFGACETVVSYNGKSFDLPLLRTRYVANRIPFRLDAAANLDLLHAARRFWKLRLQDCSLPNIERHILGVQRHGDVASEEIPQLWFDYLHTRDARPLERVFYHHQMDVLSLVVLTALLSQSLEAGGGEGFEHAEDRISLVRLHFRHKRYDDVVRLARGVLETEVQDVLRRECLELMGFACKRLKQWDLMAESWGLMLEQFPSDLVARHELAKHYEHRARDLAEAERICAEAVQLLETRAALERDLDADAWQLESFQRRLDRIRRKLARAGHLDGVDEGAFGSQ